MTSEALKKAQKKYYSKPENRRKKVEYMKEYRSRPYVKARYHKYYKDKLIRDNENDKLNAKNTERLGDV
tara:strand:- start:420 stop:626 length:207 start_codon:yes stop_codon:yes gene_type:complete